MPEFAYRPVLQELTEVVNRDGLDPYEAYSWLYAQGSGLGLIPETYLSSSITSGGHARDDSLQVQQVITRNTESARLLADQLAADGQIRPEAAIEPVFVGKTHWNQAQFMEFWLSVIGGYELTPGYVARDVDNLRAAAQESFRAVELDMDRMLSKDSAEARAQEYFRMSNAFASLIHNGLDAKPVHALVRMIDTDMSLGAQAERVFARQVGIKVMNICIVRPAQPSDLGKVNHALARDTERLIKFGATVFDTDRHEVRLMLVNEAA